VYINDDIERIKTYKPLKIIDKSFLKKDFEQIKDMIRGIELGG
jgi:hypothetical protein